MSALQVNNLPTPEQFLETAQRFRTIVEYGLSGMTLGDNEAARIAIACEIAADFVGKGVNTGAQGQTAICQCENCRGITPHASSCAVHNAPAMAVGPCDCGILETPQ